MPIDVSKLVAHVVVGKQAQQQASKLVAHAVMLSPVADSVQINKLVVTRRR
jgi:hypothetical protein